MRDDSSDAFDKYIYLTHLAQAVCTTEQASFYRSNGMTMGALYWQLNDVWTGASWSSIDASARPKPLHYAIGRVFRDPFTLIAHNTDDMVFALTVVSSLRTRRGIVQ